MTYYVTVHEDNNPLRAFKKEVTEKQFKKIVKIGEFSAYEDLEPKPKKIVLPYEYLGAAKWEEITDEDFAALLDGEDSEKIEEYLQDSDYVNWNDETGEEDNKKPFRLLINDKWLIEFKVIQGDCCEATWQHRIWYADIDYIKVIEQK